MGEDNTRDLNEAVLPRHQSDSEANLAAMGAAIKLSESTWTLPEKLDTHSLSNEDHQRADKITSSFKQEDNGLIHSITQKRAIPFYSADSKEIGIRFGKDKDYSDHIGQQPYLGPHHGQAAHLYFNVKF